LAQKKSAGIALDSLVVPISSCLNSTHGHFLQAAIDEAGKGLAAGGIPIGSLCFAMEKSSGSGTTSACSTAA
jgi:hypothetical protein